MTWEPRDRIWAASLLAWLVVYIAGGADTFQPADSAEFLTVAATGGVAHPPGYPLYTWLGWLACSLLPTSVPTALAILAALLTWLTLLGLFATLRALDCPAFAAWWGASVAGASLHLWKHATHPEAFALLGTFAAWLCFFAVLASDPQRQERTRVAAWWAYAFVAGLASAHHHTIVLTFPVGLFVLYRLLVSPKISAPARTFAWGVAAFLVGLLPYLHLYWRGALSLPGSWGHLDTLAKVWGHFLREEFGTFQSGIYKASRPTWFHSTQYLTKALFQSFWGGLSLFWVAGMLAAIWRRRGGILMAFLASWACCGLLFPTQLQMGTSPLDQSVAARFFLLPDVFLGLFVGLGMGLLVELFGERAWSRWAAAACVLWLGLAAVFQAPHGSSAKRRWLEHYARDLLKELPKGAVLLEARDEAVCFGVAYLQQVVGLRRDVRFLCLPMLARRWYVERKQKAWPEFRYPWRPRQISSLSVIAAYRKLGRPVHSTLLYNRSIQRMFLWMPYGLSWRVLGAKERPPAPEVVERGLRKRFGSLRSMRPLPSPKADPWPAQIIARYGHPWRSLAEVYAKQRKPKAAVRCYKRAQAWALPED